MGFLGNNFMLLMIIDDWEERRDKVSRRHCAAKCKGEDKTDETKGNRAYQN